MAEAPQNPVVDNMHRTVDVLSYGADAKSFIQEMMMGKVTPKGKPPGHTEKEDNGKYKKLEKVLEDIEESFSGILKDAEKSAKKIGEIYKKLSGGKAAPGGGGSQATANMKVEADTSGADKEIDKLNQSVGGFGNNVTESLGKISPAAQEAAWHLRFVFNAVGRSMQKATNLMVGGIAAVTGGLTLGHMFEGVVGPTIQFERSMRRTLHQTQGIGGSVVHMQEELTKVRDIVQYTGRMRHKFLKAYDANMKKGIRTQKETMKITRTGLGLANLIGDSTDSTAESMHEWSMKTGATTQQMGALAYKIREVARDTGVTGENLANIVKQSAAMTQNFRDAGSYSTNIAGSIISMNAAASTLGAEKFMGEFQKGMTSMDGWRESSMSAMISVSAIASGMKWSPMDLPALLEDPEKTRKLLKSMEQQVLKVHKGSDYAVKSLQEVTSGDYAKRMRKLDLASGTNEAITAMQQLKSRIKSLSGMDLGAFTVGIEAALKGTRTFSQKIEDLHEQYKGNLSIEEARLYKEKLLEKTLGAQHGILGDIGATQDPFEEIASKLALMDAASLKHIGVSDQLIAQAAKEGVSIEEMFKDPKSSASMEAMGGVLSNFAANVKQKIERSGMTADQKTAALADLSPEKIAKAMTGDRADMMNFMDKAQAAEQSAARALQKDLHPIDSAADSLLNINEKMGELVQASTNWFAKVMGKWGIMLLLLGGVIAAIVKGFGVVALTSWIPGIKAGVGRGGVDALKLKGVASGLKGIPGRITRALTGTGEAIGGRFKGGGLRHAKGTVDSGLAGIAGGKLKGIGSSKFLNKIPGVGKALTGLGAKLASMGAVSAAAGGGVSGAVAGLGSLAAPLAGIVGPALAVVAVLGGVIGAFKAGAKAAEIYGIEQEQVTFNQKYAAQEAGFLTGALNMLTFGVFSKWVGSSGIWTQGLAQFFAALGPIRYLVTWPIRAIITAFQVLWGVIKGLGVFVIEVFKGIWAGIKIALSPFMELGQFIMGIGSSIAGMLGQNKEGPSLLSKIGDVTEWIVGAFRMLGKVVGWVAKAIGWLIKIALMPAMFIFKLLAGVIGGVIKGVILFTKAILKPFQQVWKSIKSIFATILEPFVEMWNSIKEIFGAIGGLFGSTGDSAGWMMSMMDGIATAFEWVGKIIGWVINIALQPLMIAFKVLGFAIKVILSPFMFLAKAIGSIAKLIKGEINFGEFMSEIGSALMALPKLIWSGLVAGFKFLFSTLPTMIYTGLLSIPKMLYGFVGRMFSSLGLDKVAKYFSAVSKVFGSLINIVKAIFTLNFSALWDGIKGLGGAIWDVIKSIPGMLWEVFSLIPSLLWKGFKFLYGTLPKMILTGLLSIPKMLFGFVGKIFSALGLDKIGKVFSGLSKVFGSLINIVKAIFTLDFSALWSGIKGLASSLWNVIKSIPGMIWQGIMFLPSLLWKAIKGIGLLIWEGIKMLPGLLLKGLKWALVGIVAVMLGIPALIIYGLYKAHKWLTGMVWKGLKATGKFLLKLPGMIWSGIKTLVKWLWKAMTFIPVLVWNGIKNLMAYLWSAVKSVGKFLIGIPGMILRGILSIPGKIWEGIKWLGGKLANFFSWVWGGIKKIPGMIWDGIKSIGAALPGVMLDAIKWVGKALLTTLKWALIGIAAVLIGIPVLIVYGLYKALGWLTSMVWKGLKGIVKFIMKVPGMIWKGLKATGKFLLKLPGMIWSGIKWVVKALWKAMTFIPILVWNAMKSMMKWLWTGVKKLGGLLWDGVKAVGSALTYIPRQIWKGMKWVSNKLKKALSWIWKKIEKFFGWMWKSLKSVGKFLLELPNAIWMGIKAAAKAVFVDFPKWLWNGFKTALTKVWDWIKSWFGGAGAGVTEAELETSDDPAKQKAGYEKRMLRMHGENWKDQGIIETGYEKVMESSIISGAGRMLGGDILGGGSEMAVSLMAKPAQIVGGIISGIGSLFGWSDGTTGITKSGLAVVHAGEMIVPADIKGSMAEGPSGGVETAFSGLWDSIGGFFGRGMESAQSAISKLGKGDILGAAGDIASGAWDSVKSVGSMLNPLNWFGGGGGKKESDIVKIPKITPLEAISTNVAAIKDLLKLGLVKPVEEIGLGEVAEGVKAVKEAIMPTQVVQGGLDMRGTGTGGRPIAAEMVKAVDESLLAPGATKMEQASITPLKSISIDVTAIRELLEVGIKKTPSVEEMGKKSVVEVAAGIKAIDASMMTGSVTKKAEDGGIWSSIKGFLRAAGDVGESAVSKLRQGGNRGVFERVAGDVGGGMWDVGGGMWSSIKGFLGAAGDVGESAVSKLGQGDILGAAGDVGGGMWSSVKSLFGGGTTNAGVDSPAVIAKKKALSAAQSMTSRLMQGGITNAGIKTPASLASQKALMSAQLGQMSVGGPASLAGGRMSGTIVNAMSAVLPTADIHDRVQRDIAGSEASTAVGGKELSMISSSTDQQCATLVEIRDHLKAMRDTMKLEDTSSGYSASTVDGADTGSNIQPKSSPNYYRWQFGQHGQVGNKQRLNPGT